MLEAELEEKAQQLAERFRVGFLTPACLQFRFDDGRPFYLQVSTHDFSFRTGEHGHPDITLYLDAHETCWSLLEGRLNGMQAFMEGRYRADGNIVLSQLLLYLFSPQNDTVAYTDRE